MEVYRPHILQVATELMDGFERRQEEIDLLAQPEILHSMSSTDESARREVQLGVEFANSVREFVIQRPETGDRGLGCLKLGLACARILARDDQIVRFLEALGQWFEKRQPQLAERYYDQGIAAARKLTDHELVATLLSHKGELLRTLSQPETATKLLEEALSAHNQLGNRDMEAATLRSLGETHWRLGHHDKAWNLHQRALEIYRGTGNRSGEADMINKMGSVQFNRGDKNAAIELFEQALQIHREVGNRSMEAEDKNDIGVSYAYMRNPDKALPPLIDALMIHDELGSRRLRAISMCNIANVHIQREYFEAAREIADEALQIAGEVEDQVVESWALSWKGLALKKLGSPPEHSLELFREAVEKSRTAKNKRGEAGHLGNLGILYRELGDTDKALKCFHLAARIMVKNELEEAFGGKRLEDFQQMIAEIESE